MTAVQFVTVGFLTISTVAFTAQLVALAAVVRKSTHAPSRGLVRTIACRVTAAGFYVGLGVGSLFVSSAVAVIAGFVVYSVTQLMWLTNSYADLRLGRPPTARHRH